MTARTPRQFAIARRIARSRQAAAATAPAKAAPAVRTLGADVVPIHLDLQSASLATGKGRNGQTWARFGEPGQRVVLAFGGIADELVATRYARGMADVSKGRMLVVARSTPDGLVDERGRAVRTAA